MMIHHMNSQYIWQGISYLLSLAATKMSVLFLIVLMATCSFRNSEVYAFVITSNNSQEWVDTSNNIKIQFVYDLHKPTINNLNELNFTVQNLKTGDNVKNITANIAVINSPDPTFKFDNVTASGGIISVRCPFLNEGMHQVIVNIRSNNNQALALASFNLNVPMLNNSS
jgi:hypothetical protein